MAPKKNSNDKSKAKDAGGKSGKGGKDSGKSGKGDSEQKPAKVKGAQAIRVYHILCSKHSKREEALAKLLGTDGGEPQRWDTVAEAYAEEKARNAGDLGWQERGKLDPEFEKVAYALSTGAPNAVNPPSTYGQVKTQFGYHIILVKERR